jgi:hypothetical protein
MTLMTPDQRRELAADTDGSSLLIADRSSSIKLQLRDLGSERSWASNSTCRVRTAGARGCRRPAD